MKERPKILISRPCHSHYEYENDISLHNMKVTTQNAGYSCLFHFNKGSNIVKSRINGVETAKQCGAKWILFVDSDMLVCDDSLIRLLKWDSHIISGTAVNKQPPFATVAIKDGKRIRYKPTGRIEVDEVGFGFILIKMAVFDMLVSPYFKMEADIGEDFYFCRKARKCGYKIFVDGDCIIGHIGTYIYSIDDLTPENENIPLLVDSGGKVLVQ